MEPASTITGIMSTTVTLRQAQPGRAEQRLAKNSGTQAPPSEPEAISP